MTWPFENDTSAITKKIAKNDIDKNRVKKVFSLTTIVFATALLMMLIMFESGYETEKEKYSDFIEKLEASFSDPSVVLNPLSELEKHQDEYIYFRTGNSWTMRGAFYGAQVIFGELGYDKENLDDYREYVFGNFKGNLLLEALGKYTTDEIKKGIENMEEEPFYIYING